MLDRRHWRLYLSALVLSAGGVFLTLSVLASLSAKPSRLDPLGGAIAYELRQSLGAAVYVFLAGWFVVVVRLALRRSWLGWSLRSLGWLLLIPATAVLAERWPELAPAGAIPPLGPGGSIGAWLNTWQQNRLQPLGQNLFLGSCLAFGVMLTLDDALRLLLRLLWWCLRANLDLPSGKIRSLLPRSIPRIVRTPLPAEAEDIEQEKASAPDADESEEAAVGAKIIPIHHHNEIVRHEMQGPHLFSAPRRKPVVAAVSDRERFADYELPSLKLLEDAKPFDYREHDQQLRDRAALLEKTFTDFGLNVHVVGINTGPVVTQFEIALETGLRVHKITRLDADIALNLKVPSVRIVAPIPGKNTVGIEVPNDLRADVRLKEVLMASAKKVAKSKIPLFLGKDSEGRPLVHDLADMPHLLIAGTTGTGKSVCLNTIILSILMTRRPDEIKMIMLDPKGGVEMEVYSKIPHLMHPIVTDMKKSEAILAWAVDKMEERYDLLRRARVRNIAGYNELKPDEILRRVNPQDDEERRQVPLHMPYIVIVIDEMSDLMLQMKKEVEGHIIRLAQKSRAAGIHLVVATQKPTVDVITGLIKSNLPSRICFKVTNKSDSRVVLDAMGADKLLGRGDMLFLPPGTSDLIRAQGTYASDREIQEVVSVLESEPCYAPELMELQVGGKEGSLSERLGKREDELYEPAIEIILREGRGSVSLLQRALGIGYGRAARLIDFMAEDGIVGGYNGSNAREVLYTPEQWASLRGAAAEEA
ncbi:MAG TPA: DNA translocase FtsK 4TM domain-containing protein [Gemmataceae bacterium]|nr:DNA translocase FtsK 4TM domain-containing protein [Gemmataceae bacterium]